VNRFSTAISHPRLTDSHQRVIHDLRVRSPTAAITKCVYCRTGEVGAQYPELSIEEYLRLIKLFVGLGITKVRLTGGEPLLRRGVVELVQELAALRTLWDEPLDLALTTNGHLLDGLAAPLKAAGLHRVTVSMDAVDAPTFERITRVPGSFETVLAAFAPHAPRGSTPLKINCVLLRGFNDDQIEGFARFARQEDVVVRFIEFMPLEEGRLWSPEIIVPLKRDCRTDQSHIAAGRFASPARPVRRRGATPLRTAWARSASSRRVSQAFCGACSRLRLTSDGQDSHLSLLAGGARSLWALAGRSRRCGTPSYILQTVQGKEARHHIGEPGFLKPSRSMVHIGG